MRKVASLILFVIALFFFFDNIKIHAYSREDLFLEKVKNKLSCDFVEISNIYDFNLAPRYLLASGDNNYLIFDTFIDDFVEYSNSSKSIYDILSEDCTPVYLMPTYYFYYKDTNFFGIDLERKLTERELLYFKRQEESLELHYYEYIENRTLSSSVHNSITNSYYFENLGNNIHNNTDGSCSYIALEMVMQYYDNMLSDNIIDENFDVPSSKTFSCFDSICTESYLESPGTCDEFHYYLLNYGRTCGYTDYDSNYIPISCMSPLLYEIYSNTNISISNSIAQFYTNKENFCKNAINNNKPVVIWIYQYATEDADLSEDFSHDVVGYKYDENGIYVHFGWKSLTHSYSSIVINEYVINEAVYFNVQCEHFCNNNYLWNSSSINGSVCTCGSKICSHNFSYNNNYEISGHQMKCSFCDEIKLEMHNFTPSGRGYRCSICSYYTLRPIILNAIGDENE